MTSTDVVDAEFGMEFDEGNMCVFDTSTGEDLAPAAQALVHRLFKLERVVDGSLGGMRVVKLPEGVTAIPREKPVPKASESTKWEVFAKEKGIQKKKRDRMVWDEESQSFKPRYGYKSRKSLKDVPVLEHTSDLADGENPFTKKKRAVKDLVEKNEKKRQANEKKSRRKGAAPLPSLVEVEKGPSGKGRIPQKQLAKSAKIAQRSTASVGRFDKRVGSEADNPQPVAQRRKFDPVSNDGGIKVERKRALKIAERIFLPKPEPVQEPKEGPLGKKAKKQRKKH
ncbi:hypothetical protein NDN08_004730 [Rhodosorus marinus]|uniref:Ribosome biogenesis regulatory protein n=1 Tax=Rhodosorus marinus TaxID=101924 RepID=A0AAV8UPW1_9RHOD|nr:hypothetical protein NDN08_004730 [Rhodosorus marinus]